jgi:transposase InsO family protein
LKNSNEKEQRGDSTTRIIKGIEFMLNMILALVSIIFHAIRCIFISSPADIYLENIALRRQVKNFKREKPRPRLSRFDRIFWVWLRRLWGRWLDALIIVKPETVVRWHRKGFKLYWKYISRPGKKKGRKKLTKEVRQLIREMAMNNPTWRAPRIHGELLKLGFDVCERSVSRYIPRRPPDGDKIKKWLAFLNNHRKGIAAMDFFIVPTLFFIRLYCFFIIHHEKRKIIHFNVTFNPTAEWVIHQLETAFSLNHNIRYLIFDRDSIFSTLVKETVKSFGIEPVRTSFRSPWQNGVAERWVGNCRRELLNHVIVMNQNHLYRLMEEYVNYYNDDRTHYSLNKDSPSTRPVLERDSDDDKVIALPRVGGLHHKYVWRKSA